MLTFQVFCLSAIWTHTQRNPIPTFLHFQPFSSPSDSCLMILLETLIYKVISGLCTAPYSPSPWYHCPMKKSLLLVVLGIKNPKWNWNATKNTSACIHRCPHTIRCCDKPGNQNVSELWKKGPSHQTWSSLFSLAHMSRSIWGNTHVFLNKTMTDNKMRFYKCSQMGKVNVRPKIKHQWCANWF